MVFYNKSALDDIERIFIGLLEWRTKDNKQLRMTFDEVWDYRNDLFNVGNSLDTLIEVEVLCPNIPFAPDFDTFKEVIFQHLHNHHFTYFATPEMGVASKKSRNFAACMCAKSKIGQVQQVLSL